jgi:hypothetical protein
MQRELEERTASLLGSGQFRDFLAVASQAALRRPW